MGKKLLSGILILILVVAGCTQPPAQAPAPATETPAPTEMPETQPTEPTSDFELLKVVGQIGGPTQAVAVQGNYAYVSVGLRLIILDITSSANPTEVGATEPFGSYVEDVAVAGNTAFVAAGVAGLYIVDTSDPARPTVLGSYDTPGYAEGVAVSGRYVYVADGWAGLQLVDISDPTHPTDSGSVYTLGYAFDVAVAEKYAYVAGAGAGLRVVDISDPAQPVEIGSYNTPGYAHDVDIGGNIAYIADEWEGLRVVDVSEPTNPREIGFYTTPGQAFGVAVVESKVYVADAFAGLRVVDISNPAVPTEVGAYEVNGHAGQVAVAGSIAYVADRDWGLRGVDIYNPEDPTQVGFYSPLGYARDVAVAGNHAYVAAAYYGLRVLDLSNPSDPVQIGVYNTLGYAISVAVAGNYAYVATMSPALPEGNALHVVDISNPAKPTRLGFYDFGGGPPRDMAVAEGIAYIVNEWALVLVSLTDPKHPTQLGFIDLYNPDPSNPGCTVGIAVSGSLAYVAVSPGGLNVVDVSDPSSPKLVGVCEEFFFPQELALGGGYAYVADINQVKVVDVSNPVHPTVVGSYDTPGYAISATVSGDTLYVCDANKGVLVMDVSEPSNPSPVKYYDTQGYTHKVRIVSSHAYVADGNGGMLILETESTNGKVSNEQTTHSEISGELDGKAELVAAESKLPLNTSIFAAAHLAAPTHNASSVSYQIEEHRSEASPTDHHFDSVTGLSGDSVLSSSGKTLIVTSAADSGPGTLRWCLKRAVNGDTIIFDRAIFPPDNPVTITLSKGLPSITQGNLTIDASNAGVIVDGSNLTERMQSGLDINSDYNVIKGLQILNFPGCGVSIRCGAKHNTIGGNRTRGTGPMGEGNLISGNKDRGIFIADVGTMYNTIIGNFIGTDSSGKKALGNQHNGVQVCGGASNNRIGGVAPGERNIISANGEHGVQLIGREVSGNRVTNNYIGTDNSGTYNMGNGGDGIAIECGAFNNLVESNLISNNGRGGIRLSDWGTSYNTIIGNYIGTDASGMLPLGNSGYGIFVGSMGASFNRIGGTTVEERNIISGNEGSGIDICGPRNVGNLIMGNFIGTDLSGTRTIGNMYDGISVSGTSERVFIGGLTESERNVISGNGNGISLGNDFNWVAGNYIGIGAGGSLALGNNGLGISIDSAKHNTIQANLLSNNKQCGIRLKSAVNNIIFHNNFIDNRQNGFDDTGANFWDSSSEGNYWSDYPGRDTNGDGIGDNPYEILGSAGAKDRHPLIEPYSQ